MRNLYDWPPVWLGLCLVLAYASARFIPLRLFGAAGDVGGGVMVLAGLGLMALAAWEMTRARTTVVPRRAASSLVTSGVFQISRNPIYLGDSLVLIGACLIFDTVLGLALVPAFVWVINTRFIEGEEASLARDFADDFAKWSKKTRRWL